MFNRQLKQLIGKTTFYVAGWTYTANPSLLEDKQVLVGFPHTSNRDGVLALALFAAMGIKVHSLMKKELFKGPLGYVLTRLGALPVDRHSKNDVVAQMVAEFNQRDKFSLAIAPDSTRARHNTKTRKPIKTGFWYIAKGANVPIILMISDNKKKHGYLLGKIYPNNLVSDLKHIQTLYAKAGVDIVIPTP